MINDVGVHQTKSFTPTYGLNDQLDDALVKGWIAESYDLIYKALPKATRAQLENRKP